MAKDGPNKRKDPNKVHLRNSPGIPQLLGVGEMAKRLGVRTHVVFKYVNTRRIQPVAWAGSARIFDESVLDEIRNWLDDRAEKKMNSRRKQTA